MLSRFAEEKSDAQPHVRAGRSQAAVLRLAKRLVSASASGSFGSQAPVRFTASNGCNPDDRHSLAKAECLQWSATVETEGRDQPGAIKDVPTVAELAARLKAECAAAFAS